MGVLLTITTVIFIILCILLVILIMLQSDKSAGLGLLGGSSQSAFGSSTADVITKITGGMIALFLVLAMAMAYLESAGTMSLEDKIRNIEDETEETVDVKAEGITKESQKTVDSEREDADKETNVLNKKTK